MNQIIKILYLYRKHLEYESKLIENILHIPRNCQNISTEVGGGGGSNASSLNPTNGIIPTSNTFGPSTSNGASSAPSTSTNTTTNTTPTTNTSNTTVNTQQQQTHEKTEPRPRFVLKKRKF